MSQALESISADGLSKRYLLSEGWLRARRARRGSGGVVKPRREIWALRDASFTLEPGSLTGLVGPSGAGKTTLLRILSGAIFPTAGRAVLNGRVTSLLRPSGDLDRKLSGRENVLQAAETGRIGRRAGRDLVDRITEFAGLERFIDTPVKHYSTGMQMRLAFSIAVNMDAEILLIDECLSVGDIVFQERCVRRVQEAAAEGATVLLVSHDLDLVSRMCGRAMWLDGGRLVDQGEAGAVVDHYRRRVWAGMGQDDPNAVGEQGELLRTVAVSGSDCEIESVGNEGFDIRSTVRVHRPQTTVRFAHVLQAHGETAFRSVSPPFAAPEPGVYSASMRIPPEFLASAVYTVKAGAYMSSGGDEDQVVRRFAASFRVSRPDLAGLEDGSVAGYLPLLAPRLAWSGPTNVAPSAG